MIPKNAIHLPFRYLSFIQYFHQEKNLHAYYDEEKQEFYLEFIPDKNVELLIMFMVDILQASFARAIFL